MSWGWVVRLQLTTSYFCLEEEHFEDERVAEGTFEPMVLPSVEGEGDVSVGTRAQTYARANEVEGARACVWEGGRGASR